MRPQFKTLVFFIVLLNLLNSFAGQRVVLGEYFTATW